MDPLRTSSPTARTCARPRCDDPNPVFLDNSVYITPLSGSIIADAKVLSLFHDGFQWPVRNPEYDRLSTLEKIGVLKTAIREHQSIGVIFVTIPSFYTFHENSDYHPPYPVDIDTNSHDLLVITTHVVSLVGFTNTAWIVRNQFGTGWGRSDDPGYLYWAFGAMDFESNVFFHLE